MIKHTPGLLKRNEYDALINARGEIFGVVGVALVSGGGEETVTAVANTRRVEATWNACHGIPTEALEAGVVKELLEALEFINGFMSANASYQYGVINSPDEPQRSPANLVQAAIAKAKP